MIFRLNSSAFLLVIFILLINWSCSEKTSSLPEIHVQEGYSVEVVAGPELVDYPMFATLDETGRLFLFESTGNVYEENQDAIDNPQFQIRLLEDLDGDGKYDKSTIFADKLSFPQGGVFYQGSLYATSSPDLLKLTDTDGDGVADEREVILSGWFLNVNANSLIGPFMGPDGWLYMTNAIMGFDVTTKEGERLKGETARIWRVRPDGSDLEWISAGGMNNPVELTFTDVGEVIGTQTFYVEPERGLRDAITYWTEGGIYGKRSSKVTRDQLPRTGDILPVVTKYSRVAPAGIGTYRNTVLGDDFYGNLFTTQFNTHSVLRHNLIREGASFRTEDEPFFWSDNEDFHPTDVLEDADGSLLVVETGGWFILGCPLSQVSKPQLKGSLYRIRKNGAPNLKDPYGNQINWLSISSEELAVLLEDSRPFVSDRAQKYLIEKKATEPLKKILSQSTSSTARIKAVFALYRIGSKASLEAILPAFEDTDSQVRIAAARASGLAKFMPSIPQLTSQITNGEHAEKRQAATALGQIGDPQSVSILLDAASTVEDRFIEHAIIFALISLNSPNEVFSGLKSNSPKIKQVSLIALDQIKGSPIGVNQVIPLLSSEDSALQQTALWVASHHPDWTLSMKEYLTSKLKNQAFEGEEEEVLSGLFTGYCGNADMQAFMADQVKKGSRKTQLFLLKMMKDCPEKELPEIWINLLGDLLKNSSDPAVVFSSMELARLRQLKSLSGSLTQISNNASNPSALRIGAIGALTSLNSSLSEKHFNYLFEQLKIEKEAPALHQITAILSQTELAESQLLQIAKDYLPQADPFMLSRLVPVFEGASSPEIGTQLANQLILSPGLDGFTEEKIQSLFENYPEEMDAKVQEVLAALQKVRSERLQRITELEAGIGNGSIEKGRELFYGKAICWTCHAMNGDGGNLGPDLTSIQKDRSVHDIVEAIAYPSVSFVREYETYKITTQSGEHLGVIKEQTPDFILLNTGPQASVRIPRDEIVSVSLEEVSLMPQGLDKLLTEEEFADLMAYLLGKDLVY